MESEVKLKGERGFDLRMIVSGTNKRNNTMDQLGVKLKSNKEREPEGTEVGGLDQTELWRRTQETTIAAKVIAVMVERK